MYSLPIAYLLWLFSGCGALGLHRFYLDKAGSGILYLFTGGIFMLGGIYDLFNMPRLVNEANLRKKLHLVLQNELSGCNGPTATAAPNKKKEPLEKTILSIAKKTSGKVTPGEVALQGECSLEQAREMLDKLAKKGFADIRIKESGFIVYYFPDFSNDSSETL